MEKFIHFLIGFSITLAVFVFLIFVMGITHTKKGYVSIIEKRHEFHCVEIRKFSYYLPVIYHKVRHYPTKEATIKVNGYKITYQIQDYMELYKSKRKLKDIIKEVDNLELGLKKYGVKLIKIE